jgi:hypothetical protein
MDSIKCPKFNEGVMKVPLATIPLGSGYAEKAELNWSAVSAVIKRVHASFVSPRTQTDHYIHSGSLDLSLPHPLNFLVVIC